MSKAVSKSISLNEEIWVLVDDRAANTPARDRSGYFANLVEEDLRSAGVLPIAAGEDVVKLTAKVAAAVRKDPTLGERIEAVISRSTRRMAAA